MKEVAIYALQKSPTKRARSLNEGQQEGGDREKNEGKRIELIAYHGRGRNQSEGKCYQCSAENDIK